MDNLCHTLVGAAMGEAGLKRRARLAMPALLLGANLPDVDVFAYFRSPIVALGFRRGWTHGPIGVLFLSLALAGLLTGISRLRSRSEFSSLFLVTLAAALTHPVLDFLNNYGVRWLMPFDRSWYYGDTLFIVDPWIWAVLAAGVVWSRRRERRERAGTVRPAKFALAAVTIYIMCMGGISILTRRAVARELAATGPIDQLMVMPVALNPFERDVLVETDGTYRFGRFSWLGARRLVLPGHVVDRNGNGSLARAAAASPEGRVFLSWSRFPYYLVDESKGLVRIMDARYNADWASVSIALSAISPVP